MTVAGTGAVIDELRLYPSDAQMETSTFDLFVGVSSQCDARNQVVYYEYDGFNRLILVRQHDKTIVKQVCYNYAGQVENCNVTYNTAQTATAYKNCGSGYMPTPVSYQVPDGMFAGPSLQAANDAALNEATQNAQWNANQSSVACIPGMNINGYNSKSSM